MEWLGNIPAARDVRRKEPLPQRTMIFSDGDRTRAGAEDSLAHALSRRQFVGEVGGALAVAMIAAAMPDRQKVVRRTQAIAFDGYAIFDASILAKEAEAAVPGHGRELLAVWRARQFEYQWLRTLGDRYADFEATGADALLFALETLSLELDESRRRQLLEAQTHLVPWPGAPDAVDKCRAAGLRLSLLSNMTTRMLDDGARRAGIRDAFEHVLSTDRVRAAKPDRRAYAMGPAAFGLPTGAITFVAFAGWDAAGASWFGLPTIWTNRSAMPAEVLGAENVRVCRGLDEALPLLMK